MKTIFPLAILVLLACGPAIAQTTLNPNDPIVIYNRDRPPVDPPWGSIGKWVITNSSNISWSTTSFKAYIYKGMAFRLKFPRTYQHGVVDGKKYPVYLFFHGLGEARPATDNNLQLLNGGRKFRDAVDNGAYDGFLLYPQSVGAWGALEFDKISEVLDSMASFTKADLNRITVNGLSSGGYASWEFMIRHPQKVSASLPMSGVANGYADSVDNYKYTPIWLFQGGQDGAPAPYTAQQVVNLIRGEGGTITYTVYPNDAHNTWDHAWQEPDFIPFMLRAHLLNPKPLFGQTTFCAGDTITIGISPFCNGYEWQKDNVTIPGAVTNELKVRQPGTYRVRVRRGEIWSEWSPLPLVLTQRPGAAAPAITMAGTGSNVIPAPDGSTRVSLRLPPGMEKYEWKRTSDGVVVSRTDTFGTAAAGKFIARVKATGNCFSAYSDTFRVVNSKGTNGPDGISGLAVSGVTPTQVTLKWNNVTAPVNNEKAFEVYRAVKTGGPYILAGSSAADVLVFGDEGLLPNTTYFYIVRPVNDLAAGPLSAEVKAITAPDNAPPSSPPNLRLTTIASNLAILAWDAATDDTGVGGYDIFVNGTNALSANGQTLTATVNSLSEGTVYNFTVKAKDVAGRYSAASNQVSAVTKVSGLAYKYYRGYWSSLPNFNNLTPNKTGRSAIPDLSPRTVNDYFAFMWTGYIRIPVSGTYIFETNSDDGSRLYFNQAYSPTAQPLVDNNGVHEPQFRAGALTIAAGVYPVTITYFDRASGQLMDVYWTCNELGVTTRQKIPAAYYMDNSAVSLQPPALPATLTAAPEGINKIKLGWQDKSSNESGFEIYRSTGSNGPFQTIATAGANVTAFTDTGLPDTTVYFYKIRAIGASGESGFSNVASARTAPGAKPPSSYRLYINLTQSSNAPAPWNNMSAAAISDLKNDQGGLTGTGLVFDSWWWATSTDGPVAGGNSGVYPDAVMKEYMYFGSVPGFFNGAPDMPGRFTGLDTGSTYSIRFHSGSNWWAQPDNGTTTFAINGITRSLAVQGNTTNTVIFEGLRPTATGEIGFTVGRADGSNAGFLNAIELSAVPAGQTAAREWIAMANTGVQPPAKATPILEVNVYPNPFRGNLAVDVTLPTAGSLLIEIWDMSGRNLHRELRPGVPQGRTTLRLNTARTVGSPGAYLLKLTTPGGESKVVQLIRQ